MKSRFRTIANKLPKSLLRAVTMPAWEQRHILSEAEACDRIRRKMEACCAGHDGTELVHASVGLKKTIDMRAAALYDPMRLEKVLFQILASGKGRQEEILRIISLGAIDLLNDVWGWPGDTECVFLEADILFAHLVAAGQPPKEQNNGPD